MVTASFTGLIKALAIIILTYYALKYLMRLFAPMIMQQVVKKAGEAFYEQQNRQAQASQQQYSRPVEKPREKKKVGEYIDYEEIE